MILRTTQGASFKGVGQYVLHDKGTTASHDRVAFAETLNTSSDRANVALAEMIDIATHQPDIRRAHGKRGTKTNKPVYHLTLSWEVSEQPTKAEQIDAVRHALKAVGLEDHQTLIVAHTDTKNPHVHAVVNLVHPTTGDTASLSNDRLKLSQWALEYRKAQGLEHLCPQRKQNQQKRKSEWVKDQSMTRQEWEALKRSQTSDIWDRFKADLKDARASRKAQYRALWQQKEERFQTRREEIKAYYKPIWRAVFKRQRKELADFDASIVGRIKFVLSQKGASTMGIFMALLGQSALRREVLDKQEMDRRTVGKEQKARLADASREVTKAWKYDRDALRAMHKAEDNARYRDTKEQTQAIWQDKTLSPSGQDFERTADRRKDPANRRSIEDDLTEAIGADDVEKVRKQARNAERKIRKRARRPRGGGRSLDS